MYKKSLNSRLRMLCFAISLLLSATATFATVTIELKEGKIDPTSTIPDHGKSPSEIPSVSLDGYQLLFESSHPEYTVELLSGDMVVYSAFVASTATSVYFPSYLEGQYEIRLYSSTTTYYYGYIGL